MNVVTNTWRQLVRRRLWPLALLLVAALVAVPVVLATDPAPVSKPVEAAPGLTAGTDDALAEPVVAKVAAEDRTRRRRVLGARKDPFRPAPTPKKKKTDEGAKQATKKAAAKVTVKRSEPSSDSSPGSSAGGSDAPSSSPSPVLIAPKPTTKKKKKKKKKAQPAGSIVVRFGDATAETLAKGLLEKLAPLPDDVEPLIVYMGLTKNRRNAKFLVDSSLTPTGDGVCRPHPSTCETVELAKGETEFFDLVDPESGATTAQYQLDLVAINR